MISKKNAHHAIGKSGLMFIWTFVTISVLSSSVVCHAQEQRPAQQGTITISASLMAPKNVSDIFGKRISKRYVAIQITIANRSTDFQYLIHDVLIGVDDVYIGQSNRLKPIESYKPTSEDLTLVRGVAEKGQLYDPRNLFVRLLQGTGTIAAGLIGVTTFGSSYAPSVAVFNGPVISAIREVFPDMTINQLNRLNDSAYSANVLVPKQSSKVLVAFLPQAVLMDSKLRKKFWNDPLSIVDQIDFRNVETFVDGSFVSEVSDLAPVITSVVISPEEMGKFINDDPEVTGQIEGRFLDGATLSLDEPSNIRLTVLGNAEENRIRFSLKSDNPVPPNTSLKFTVTKNNQTDSQVRDVQYRLGRPSLDPLENADVAQGSSVTLALTGANLVLGADNTQVIIAPSERVGGSLAVEVEEINVKDGTTMEVKLKVAPQAPLKEYEIRVVTGGGISNPVNFEVVAPPDGN